MLNPNGLTLAASSRTSSIQASFSQTFSSRVSSFWTSQETEELFKDFPILDFVIQREREREMWLKSEILKILNMKSYKS